MSAQTPHTPDLMDPSELKSRLEARDATVGVVGLGYVGLPLLLAFLEAGFRTLGVDVDPEKISALNAGQSYLPHIPLGNLAEHGASRRFRASSDTDLLADADAVVVCVPTPLDRHRQPDLRFVVSTMEAVAPVIPAGALVVLVSTTWPGTTAEVVAPIFEAAGRAVGTDVHLAYSPEREDPGNTDYTTARIPRVVAGDDAISAGLAQALFEPVSAEIVPVSSTRSAEAVKLTENVFRAVNIALVNELKRLYGSMDIDIWEVIDAASTKPFGYMRFEPGPGLGGHCIPIDPFYLSWRARAFEETARFVELAGEINTAMPARVVEAAAQALDAGASKGLQDADILVLGVAYKRDVGDVRESPALRIIELLRRRGAHVNFHDPHVHEIPPTREFGHLAGLRSVPLEADRLAKTDLVLLVTDHADVDYGLVAAASPRVVDTRNAMARFAPGQGTVIKA